MKNNLQIIENKIKYTYEPLEEILLIYQKFLHLIYL